MALAAGAFGLYAATQAQAAPNVGVAAAVNQDATGRPPGGGVRTLALGDNVIHNERIVTSGSGLVQILLVDGSSFTVGAGSDVVIDEFVYDPNGGAGKLAISFSKGAMRFVGGKISKNAGAVSVDTGIGTIGIRGGIANLSVDPGCTGGGCDRGILSLIFGDELTFAGHDGQRRRVFQTGYTMQIDGQGGASVRPTTAADLAPVQNQLASRPGQSGGAKNKPTNQTVADSPLTEQNSGQTPVPTPPLPVARPEPAGQTDPGQQVGNEAGSDIVRRDVEEKTQTATEAFRVLTVGETLSTVDGTVTAPGYQGLAGGPGHDDIASFRVTDAGYAGTIVNFGSLALPYPDGDFTLGQLGSMETGAGTADVYAFQNAGTFVYYWLHDTADVHDYAHLFAGVPTDWDALEAANAPDLVRTYALLPDAHQEISTGIVSAVPFLHQEVVEKLGAVLENGATPGILSVDRPDGGATRYLTGGLLISGQGVDQVSAVMLSADALRVDAAGERFLATPRRGGHRINALDLSISHRGGLYSVPGPQGNHFFGGSPDNFVLSSGLAALGDPDDGFFDSGNWRDGSTDPERYSQTLQVADFAASEEVSGLTRTTRVLHGYAAGMLEPQAGAYSDQDVLTPLRSTGPSDAVMRFDADSSSVGASFRLFDVADLNTVVSGFTAVMGSGVDGSGGRRSAFVDDDRYGGTVYGAQDPQTGEFASVTTQLDGGSTVATNRSQPSAYFFNDGLMSQSDFVPASVTLCECAFLEWGWWGARMANSDEATFRRDYLHLGSWVQGDVVRADELPLTGTASYTGHAVGNVARQTAGGVAQYAAAGNFGMTWDFGARTGSMTISEFDGMAFSGTMNAPPASSALNGFDGGLTGSGLTGSANGSFVRGPQSVAQGVIGAFDMHGGGVRAAGTFMGERPLLP